MKLYIFLFIVFPIALFSQETETTDFTDVYPWIENEYPDCDGLSFEEYHNGAFAYIYASDGILYFQDGTFYCGDGVNRDCRSLYTLTPEDISKVFTCGGEVPEEQAEEKLVIELQIDTSFTEVGEEFCVDIKTSAIRDLLSFQFQLQLSNSNLNVISASSEVVPDVFTLIDDDVVKFLWFAEDILVPTDIGDDVPLVSICFEVVDDADNLTQINILNTKRLFAQFVTATSSGDFLENVDISLSGGVINVSSESTDASAGEGNLGLPIEEYPWMTDVIAQFACVDTQVTEYDFGSYRFYYFSSPAKSILYFQDGTFYCADAPTRDCRAFYQLLPDKMTNQWTCEN